MAKTAKPDVPTAQPYLKQVRIRNHAPLRDAQVSFEPGLNIIIGPNGTGKTRFVSLVARLMDPYGTHREGNGCELVIGYDQDITVSFQQALMKEEINPSFPLSKTIPLEVKAAYGTHKRTDTNLPDVLIKLGLKSFWLEVVLAQYGAPLQQMPLVDASATLTFIDNYGMTVAPEIGDSSPLLVSNILSTINSLFNRRQRYQHVHSSSYSISVEEVGEEVGRVVDVYLNFLNHTLATYSPIEQVRLSKPYQVYGNPVQQEVLIKGLVLEFFIDEAWLPFTSLSDGTKRMLYLISQLVMPTAGFESHTALPTPFTLQALPRIIFLEEPELGIHPAQLHKLLNLIREVSREHQVIMTTHAPQVLDMLSADELDRITICSLDPEKGTQFHKLSEVKQEQARVFMQETGFLSDYWRYSYLESTEA